ncbi:hypothetical protein PVAND_011571 [Polypedilum vanderplanki]|uniref:Arb2 domain-containing protein n=1 Tax=Polypedilum vanderplanki TaxID=319348 RepID=A0A9J6CJR2_POLVA|nr:hypothetical protein PVAND_011571 [Polypedilum vanderplanki]
MFIRKIFSSFVMANSMKKTLKDFGYAFNKEGKLRQIDPNSNEITDVPFQFEISSSRSKNQENYEALGEVINEYVYELLEQNNMHRLYFPENTPKEKASFVFSTFSDLEKQIDKLMIIVHGSGVVRAGQWARSLIINDSLDKGTVLPYIKRAREYGYEVIVTNTNDKKIGGRNPEEHAQNVWNLFTSKSKHIAIVAHSYGGVVVTDLAEKFKKDFDEKVFAVAFTDSVHGSRSVSSRLIDIGVNFVSSDAPLNEKLQSYNDIERRSAGTPKHELTSYQCMEKLFEFILQKEKDINKKSEL